jgi:hypothetical protein
VAKADADRRADRTRAARDFIADSLDGLADASNFIF